MPSANDSIASAGSSPCNTSHSLFTPNSASRSARRLTSADSLTSPPPSRTSSGRSTSRNHGERPPKVCVHCAITPTAGSAWLAGPTHAIRVGAVALQGSGTCGPTTRTGDATNDNSRAVGLPEKKFPNTPCALVAMTTSGASSVATWSAIMVATSVPNRTMGDQCRSPCVRARSSNATNPDVRVNWSGKAVTS